MPNKRVPQWPCDAKIYKIWWRDCTDVYVGSTRRFLLCDRMKGHRERAKQGNPPPVHAAIRRNGPFEYDLLETVSCKNFDESRTHERKWAENLKANLNQRRPICTKEERKEKMAEYNARPKKEYYAKNRREKRYPCEKCKYYAPNHSGLTRHKKSKKHLNQISPI